MNLKVLIAITGNIINKNNLYRISSKIKLSESILKKISVKKTVNISYKKKKKNNF